ncbi:MAG: arylsulfotransferase family protein [Pseudomonadota bacterium]
MKRPKISKTSVLMTAVAFTWGMAAGWANVFPGGLVKLVHSDISAFVKGDPSENLTLTQQLQNDFGGTPHRTIRQYRPVNPDAFNEVALGDRNERRHNPRLFMSEQAPAYYRLLVGAFDLTVSYWSAVLVSPDGQIVHTWALNGELEELSTHRDFNKIAYGVAVLPDGSVIVNKQERGGGLYRRSFCSDLVWTKPGKYHHSAELTEQADAFWTFGGNQSDVHPILVKVDATTGETLQEIDMADVDRANPGVSILHMTRRNAEPAGKATYHATHPNDIEPLPAALVDAFPMFEAGDLLLSYNVTNLVFVVDPDTLELKWWNFGAVDMGHDPDWQPDGTIIAFDNSTGAARRGIPEYLNIVSINPLSNQTSAEVSGREHDFFSAFNGRQQVTDAGTVLITSSTQGRFLEVDPVTGDVVFDFVNSYDWERGKTLHVSDAFAIEPATAERWLKNGCRERVKY